jgi:arginyl-tRNA synthetase
MSKELNDDLLSSLSAKTLEAVHTLWPDLEAQVDLTTPNNPDFGDYSTGIALTIAKQIKQNPLETAEKIKDALGDISDIAQVTVTAPGFVNFMLDYPALAVKLLAQNPLPKTKLAWNVSVEHTSVNPNKAAHIGHLRNACLGDTLARTLRGLGHHIEVQNYIDDLGVQVADSVVAYETFGDAPEEYEIDKWLWKIYADINKKYEANPELKARRDEVLHEMEEGKSEIAKALVTRVVPAQLKTFEKFGINYDLLVYEHDIVNNHLWDKLFEELQSKKLIVKPNSGEHAGAWVVEFGDSEREDKILVRSNGLLTYTAKDLAYALWKFGKNGEMPGYEKRLLPIDRHVNVIDERQSYPQAVIKHVMERLGYGKEAANYTHLGYGTVKLSAKSLKQMGFADMIGEDEKAAYSMSGRAGIGVMIDDLYAAVTKKQVEEHPDTQMEVAEQIAVGSIRYYMLKTRPDREIVFDFDEALRTDGNTGVYIQYSYARAKNILAKLDKTDVNKAALKELNDYEKKLIKTMIEAPQAISLSVERLDPSLVCDYAYNLATSFAKFYETSPVLKAETEEQKTFRTGLVNKYVELLSEILEMLGIPGIAKI